MPVISSSVVIKRSRNELYLLLKSLQLYPSFLTHVEHLKVISTSSNTVLTEWAVNINGTSIRWKQLDIYSHDPSTIKFQMLEGDYGQYEGEWSLQPEGESTRLSLTATLEWGAPQVSRYVDPFLRRKAELTIRSMLRAIKQRAEFGNGFRPYIPTVSTSVRFRNRVGREIVGFHDHLQYGYDSQPFIVMPPGYGETKRDTLTAAYYLARNGFNVLRYDATDHVGESEGGITNTTMGKLKLDLFSAIDYIDKAFHVSRVGVVASSLAQRMALKAAAEDSRICFLLGVVGVVNLRETLKAIYCEDIIGDVASGRIKETYDVLGFEIKKTYPISAIQETYHDLQSAIEDSKRRDFPLVFLVAEKDAWVKLDDVRVVFEASRRGEMHVIPDAMHQIFENPRASKIALKQLVVSATKHMLEKTISISDVLEPNLREVATQNQLERERLKGLIQFSPHEERRFWQEYLTSYLMLSKVPDYREFIGLIHRLLGTFRRYQVILDAGCGVGYYGAWLLGFLASQQETMTSSVPKKEQILPGGHFINLDFIETALLQASEKHAEILNAAQKKRIPDSPSSNAEILFHYVQADLNRRLPLTDNSVDKICCSLVISYLEDPLTILHELSRVLKKGGRIVITSLKPYADLSEIYRNFVSQAENEQDILEARKLLSSAGQIRQKEGHGHYKFFSERELTALMIAAGLERVKTYRSFGNQANIVVASKKAHSRHTPRNRT